MTKKYIQTCNLILSVFENCKTNILNECKMFQMYSVFTLTSVPKVYRSHCLKGSKIISILKQDVIYFGYLNVLYLIVISSCLS